MNSPVRRNWRHCWQQDLRRRPGCRSQGTGIAAGAKCHSIAENVAVAHPLWGQLRCPSLGQAHDRPRDSTIHTCQHADRRCGCHSFHKLWAGCHSRRDTKAGSRPFSSAVLAEYELGRSGNAPHKAASETRPNCRQGKNAGNLSTSRRANLAAKADRGSGSRRLLDGCGNLICNRQLRPRKTISCVQLVMP